MKVICLGRKIQVGGNYFATTGKRYLKKKETHCEGHNNEYSDVTCK